MIRKPAQQHTCCQQSWNLVEGNGRYQVNLPEVDCKSDIFEVESVEPSVHSAFGEPLHFFEAIVLVRNVLYSEVVSPWTPKKLSASKR